VRKIFKRFTLSVFILAIFIIAFILTFFSGCGEITVPKTVKVPDYTEVPVDSDHPLAVSDVSWRCDQWNPVYSLTVTGNAKNTGARTLEMIRILVKGYDSYGNIVVNNYDHLEAGGLIRSLSPGQNVNWGVFRLRRWPSSVRDRCAVLLGAPGLGFYSHVVIEVTVGYSHDDPVHTETSPSIAQALLPLFIFIGLLVGLWCLGFILRRGRF
jgi:hypothetical protein